MVCKKRFWGETHRDTETDRQTNRETQRDREGERGVEVQTKSQMWLLEASFACDVRSYLFEAAGFDVQARHHSWDAQRVR